MATQPPKENTSKKPVKRRAGRKSRNASTFKKSLLIVLSVFLMISMVVFGYFLGQNDRINGHTPLLKTYKTKQIEHQKIPEPQENKALSVHKSLTQERQTDLQPLSAKKEEKVVSKEDTLEVMQDNKVILADVYERPRLAIIIDDVSTRRQLNKIQATGLKITPSIFPPSERSMTSHTLATGLEHYMIHLPMESGSRQFNKQTKTLITTFSKEQIEARVKEIRALFPSARYVNNHTGSVYTDNYEAMQSLYRALRAEGFVFVDSRTIGSTKVPKITDEFGDAYVARDVFIDNEHNIPYIHKQLQKAVKMAKKRGFAIAIGHPHKMTMRALSSAGDIFSDVELVYIDALFRE